jgi:hypothetical protein
VTIDQSSLDIPLGPRINTSVFSIDKVVYSLAYTRASFQQKNSPHSFVYASQDGTTTGTVTLLKAQETALVEDINSLTNVELYDGNQLPNQLKFSYTGQN